ncbi:MULTISPECIES: TetR/AcrR family transcriptional regulator [Hydrogenophaga]|jgi:AcrR family transcriptional regulator|uniref:TetR family transcriptional regulator n=1 Tax=Hydrogenophaga intermedia TaxID=65786 RepID=A0A1L1PJE5_HYDIT|nr:MULTISPECIES: TetR/AcrR family transcriptional regulator [Hydrogenophaga]AOS80567.1 TetR family transcriptional regulator [Hydrogenophaga sp. PBC]TMU78221.1 TetR/AcrR family transcriptional regulator [Hydrogenophaga intermedia]CDN88864.1 TetR family transcriptional regulator [Hydrogenophaga intermedia]
MPKKAPRRTAERILETTLELFNRFGEPNVSTTLISAELGISPGNLYYHYPAKDELINSLFERYERSLNELLGAADGVRHVEDAWFFLHSLFERIWEYRFLYRDLNDLLSKNRLLETRFQGLLAAKTRAVRGLLGGLGRSGAIQIDSREVEPTADSMVVLLTYWLSFEYVRDPRRALEPDHAQAALLRGAQHVLHQLAPYLEPAQRQHLMALSSAYQR